MRRGSGPARAVRPAALAALLIALSGERAQAQDFGFVAVERSSASATNVGSAGALNTSGLLATVSGNAPLLVPYSDVAGFDGGIYAIGGDTLVILRGAKVAGSFEFPQIIRLTGVASPKLRSLAVGDVDLDGKADVMLGVEGLKGQAEVFGVAFLSGNALAAATPGGAVPAALIPVAGRPLSLTIGRFDGDDYGDIAVAEQGEQGTVRVILSLAGGFEGPVRVFTIDAGAPIADPGAACAPRLIASAALNVSAHPGSPPDALTDLAVLTTRGAVLLANDPGSTPSFVRHDVLEMGTAPTGVMPADVDADGRVDLVALDPGTRSLRTSLARAQGGYAAPSILDLGERLGAVAPVAATTLRFDGDRFADLAIADAGGGESAGRISILSGTADGRFSVRRTLGGADTGVRGLKPCAVVAMLADSAPDGIAFVDAAGLGYLSGASGYRVVPAQAPAASQKRSVKPIVLVAAGGAAVAGIAVAAGGGGSGSGSPSSVGSTSTTTTIATTTTTTTTTLPAASCSYSATPGSIMLERRGGIATCEVRTSRPSCGWTAEAKESWLQILGSGRGIGPGSFRFEAQENRGNQRQGRVQLREDRGVGCNVIQGGENNLRAGDPLFSFVSQLELGNASGQVVINGRSATYQAEGRRDAMAIARPGENRLEATVVSSSGTPGTWRFEFSGGVRPGSIRVLAGEVIAVGANTVLFRLNGTPGERVAVTFRLEDVIRP